MISNILFYCFVKCPYTIKPHLDLGLKICPPYPWKVNMNLYPKHNTYWKENILWVFYILLLKKANFKKIKERNKNWVAVRRRWWVESWQVLFSFGRSLSLEQFSQRFHWQASAEPLELLNECIVLSFLWPSLLYYLGKQNCTVSGKREDWMPANRTLLHGVPWTKSLESWGLLRIPSPYKFPCAKCNTGSDQDSWIFFFTFWLKSNQSLVKVPLINYTAAFLYLAVRPF